MSLIVAAAIVAFGLISLGQAVRSGIVHLTSVLTELDHLVGRERENYILQLYDIQQRRDQEVIDLIKYDMVHRYEPTQRPTAHQEK